MPSPVRLVGFSGSLRKESHSAAILHTLAEAIAGQVMVEIGDVGSVPHYNQDIDGDKSPQSVVAMREMVAGCDGLLIVTTEYNHGMPGVLKNALDWLSRPAFKSPLTGKLALIITSSPAFTGGVRAHYQLRETLTSALARPVVTEEVVIGGVHKKVSGGKLTDKAALDFSLKAIERLLDDVRRYGAAKEGQK